MPWTIDDVDEHKKGLTDKQKAQWVRIANSVLASCIKKGGSDKECAPKAIKQANGVVGNNSGAYAVYTNKQESDYEVELKVHQEKPHIVVPVVMIVEGVLNGSHGPLLHLADDFGKIPEVWNGIPVVINHPDQDGIPVSANSPDIIDSVAVGKVYNTTLEGKKLRAEVWLDEEKLNAVSTEILEDINSNKLVEVSVGVFTEDEESEGWYGEKQYTAIARNHKPDHLALLTECVGACSCEDGCGIRLNQKQTDMEIKTMLEEAKFKATLHAFNKEGFRLSPIGNNAEAGYREKMDAVYSILRQMEANDNYYYLEEMYDGELVFCKSSKEGTTMYKQGYQFESGKIELTGEPVQVHKKVEYSVNQLNNNFKKEETMAEPCAPCVKAKVDELIANSQGKYTEEDRGMLETLNEALLDKILTPVEKVVEKEVKVNALSDEDKAALAAYKRQLKEKRDKMIADIQTCAGEIWPVEKLKVMDDDTIERVFNSVSKEVSDYSLGGNPPAPKVRPSIAPLPPTGIEFETN